MPLLWSRCLRGREPLAAAFGMCGWLPLRQHIVDITGPQTPSGLGEDPFVRETGVDQNIDLPGQAIAWMKEELTLPPTRTSSVVAQATASSMLLPFQLMPFFIAHGTDDEKVKVELGFEAKECLTVLRADVTWREYEKLGHWYSEQMLGDLVEFLYERTGWARGSETSDTMF